MAKTITLKVDDNVYDILKKAADGNRRTISNFLEFAAINYISSDTVVDGNEMDEIIIKPKNKLSEMLNQINETNIHKEIETTGPVGKEIW
jgi:uncharacterized protein (DUF1778 family)